MTEKAPGAGRPATLSRRRLRRRLSAAVLLLIGLAVAGGLAATLTPTPQVAVADESQSALLRTGKQLFDTSCVTCHGANLQGVPDRGPSLIGVGEAAVYFQVSTGRMPAMRGEAQAARKPPIFDESQIDALGAYVQANGGGPTVPRDDNGKIAQESLMGSNVARGGDLFRLNCASCHNFTGKGGALSSGKYAPELEPAEPAQIYTAMLTGPQNMPKFSDRQLSPDEKQDIVAYVREATPRAEPWRLRPRRLRSGAGGHGDVDHRNGRLSSARLCGWEREHERNLRHEGHGHPGSERRARTAERRRTGLDVARAAGRAGRQDRRCRDRLQGGALAGSRHQGREAGRALGRVLASAGRLFGTGAAADLPVLAVGVPADGLRGRVLCTRWPRRCTA